jgi:hypothetical protein
LVPDTVTVAVYVPGFSAVVLGTSVSVVAVELPPSVAVSQLLPLW